jgi:hypothetical protein
MICLLGHQCYCLVVVVESQLKLLHVGGSDSLPNDALKWLPHHQLLTSLSFSLERDHNPIEEWTLRRDLFMIAIRSLPHLHELRIGVLNLGEVDDIPPITITSLSLRKLEFTMAKRSVIFDAPSLTYLDLSWLNYDSVNANDMVDMFINCKSVTHLIQGPVEIDYHKAIPWHVFSSNMISLKFTDGFRLSIDHYIQMLRSPQFATLETFHCVTNANWSHLLFDAILHQWKHLKDLEVGWEGGICDLGRPSIKVDNLVAQLISFIPIDPTYTSMRRMRIIDEHMILTSLSSSSSVGERSKQWTHKSLEKLTIRSSYDIEHWIIPSLRHFISKDRLNNCDGIWSFLSQSYEQLHTLQLTDHWSTTAVVDNKRNELKQITFPNLERLIISNSYVNWLYESIDAGPYLSYIQIDYLDIETCEKLINSQKPITNLTTNPFIFGWQLYTQKRALSFIINTIC